MTDKSDVINGGVTWPKLLTVLLTVMIGTMGSNVAFRIADPPQEDPFTGKDAMVLHLQIQSETKEGLQTLRQEIQESETRKPPAATRTRILAIESALKKIAPDYSKPTEDWQ